MSSSSTSFDALAVASGSSNTSASMLAEIMGDSAKGASASEVNALKNSKDEDVASRAKLAEELLSQCRVLTDPVF